MTRAARLVPALVLLAVGITMLWPILGSGGWYHAHQAYRYPYLMELFKASFLAGHVYPRWLPELFGGYGYPTFVYYPPGFWFLALPFALMLPNVIHAMYAALIALFWLGGLGAYRLGRLSLGRGPATFCAVLFLLMPSLPLLVYARGSLSEVAAMLLCPWVFYWLLRLKHALAEGRPALRPGLGLAAALTVMVAMHLLITLWLGLVLAVVLAVLLVGREWPKGLLPALSLCALLTLALASPYWVPALALRDAVAFQRGLWVGTPTSPAEFVALRPRLTGLLWSVLTLAGLWLGRKDRFVQGVGAALAVLLFFTLPISAPVWREIRLLQMTQHPGRVFSIAATLELLAIIACVGHLVRKARFGAGWRALAALLVLLAATVGFSARYRVRDPLDYARFRLEAARSFEDMTHNHELQPRESTIRGLAPRLRDGLPVAQAGEGTTLTIQPGRDDDIRLQAVVAVAPGTITLNQLAFPGWRLSLDDRPLPRCGGGQAACWHTDKNGRLRVLLPEAGRAELRAWFDGPAHGPLRHALAALGAVLGVAALGRLDRLVARLARPGVRR